MSDISTDTPTPASPWPSTLPALPATSLDALLAHQVRTRGAAVALAWRDPAAAASPWQPTTWAELAQQVHACCTHLTASGLRPGDRVAWLGLNHPALIVALFALARLGGVLVPLNHRLAEAEWQAVLADCAPRLLMHDAPFAEAARALHPGTPQLQRCLAVGDLLAPVESPADAGTSGTTRSAHANQPLLLVYTSGTTGRPKAAMHTQANLLANMAIAGQVHGLSERDTVLTVLPLFHVGGLCIQTLPALAAGARVLLMARFDAAAVLDALAQQRPSLTLQVPATLQALTSHTRWADTDLSSLRAVWAGSSLLPPAPLLAFLARGVPVCNVYGSTETGPFSIALPPCHAASHLGSCGWPAPGVAIRLVNAVGEAVAPGQVGELCVRAPNVVTHYWPDQTALDAEGFFHSGDLAQQAPDGSFTVVGRAKDMIISGGENIYPAEIENLIAQHPSVAECSVVGQADARWGELTVAVVVLRDAVPDDDWPAPLRAWLDGRLARYKWPRRWVRLDALPRTALGKVKKADLAATLTALPPN